MTNGNEPIQPIYTASGNPSDESDIPYLEGRKVLTGLTKREYFASVLPIDADGWERKTMEELVGREMPFKQAEIMVFWAEFRAILRRIEADALIAELNKQLV